MHQCLNLPLFIFSIFSFTCFFGGIEAKANCGSGFDGGESNSSSSLTIDDIGRDFFISAKDQIDQLRPGASLNIGTLQLNLLSSDVVTQDMERIASYLNEKLKLHVSRFFTDYDTAKLCWAKGRVLTPELEASFANRSYPYMVTFPANAQNISALSQGLQSERTFWFTDRLNGWSYKIRLLGEGGRYIDLFPVYGDPNNTLQSVDVGLLTGNEGEAVDLEAFGSNHEGEVITFTSKGNQQDFETMIKKMLRM